MIARGVVFLLFGLALLFGPMVVDYLHRPKVGKSRSDTQWDLVSDHNVSPWTEAAAGAGVICILAGISCLIVGARRRRTPRVLNG